MWTGSHLPFLGQGLADYKQLLGPEQDLQTLGRLFSKGWEARGGCFCSPQSWEKWGRESTRVAHRPSGPPPTVRSGGGTMRGRLGSGWALRTRALC